MPFGGRASLPQSAPSRHPLSLGHTGSDLPGSSRSDRHHDSTTEKTSAVYQQDFLLKKGLKLSLLSKRMYVCMYVCMHARTYVRMYVCMHACMYACMYVHEPSLAL